MVLRPDQWKPQGIPDLEPNAWDALRADYNTVVTAGPGAGKTEFLAQRAAYLLQTGGCPTPRRILAISFKNDAAANLSERMRVRCKEHSRRFFSVTFDSFTKGLVDRFRLAIPDAWRPLKGYEILLPARRDFQNFLTRAREAAPRQWRPEIVGLPESEFEREVIGTYSLSPDSLKPTCGRDFAVNQWWQEALRATKCRVSFVMLNRLADLLLRSHPHIMRALRATYSHVFLDEFQDTTYAQYALLQTIFRPTKAIMTAVGDDKQRIMVWAGARPDAFIRFQEDFRAVGISLLFNYRSSPELVKIQHVVAKALERDAPLAVAQTQSKISEHAAQIWSFRGQQSEAAGLARWIASEMQARSLLPRDFAILVRQTAESLETALKESFTAQGLDLLNVSKRVKRTTLQDLLSEELTEIIVHFLRLLIARRASEAWNKVQQFLTIVRGIDHEDDVSCRKLQTSLSEWLRFTRKSMNAGVNAEAAATVMKAIFEFLPLEAVRRAVPRYSIGDTLEITREALLHHFSSTADNSITWEQCLNVFDGSASVSLMTIHKSKGLEYDTIFLVGLDDDSWWSYSPENPEGASTFFVALSRAKQRAIFTYCRTRAREKVSDLYELLSAAGVHEVKFD
jgi:superfamily I DNA/RNA helicase